MDPTVESDLGNSTGFESNLNFNASTLSPTTINDDDAEQESLFHLVKKVKSVGITGLFKKLTPNSRHCVIAYVVMFIVGAPGNLYVVISVGWKLWKRRFKRSSRIRLLIWHLALADLLVTFVVIPLEIFWRLTNQWCRGNILCKSIQFVKTFGLYLSSTVIICISMDRFCAIVFPLRSLGGMKRIHRMLFAAWTFSTLFAFPQIVVFSEQTNPQYPSFRLCTNSHYFSTLNMEIWYNLFSLVIMYFAPLTVILVTYAIVFYTISEKSREQQLQYTSHSSSHLRQNGNATQFKRAKTKAVWVSVLIVTVFVVCWTPFVVITIWYIFDFETAERLINPKLREVLFVTALFNSCLNPVIYGNYLRRCFRCLFLRGCPEVLGDYTITLASSATPGTSHHLNVMNSSVGMVVSGRRVSRDAHHV